MILLETLSCVQAVWYSFLNGSLLCTG
jgi:hypothetical protein